MRAVISTTYDSKYLFFLPIVTWCWSKLGVDVICFVPFQPIDLDVEDNPLMKGWYKSGLIDQTLKGLGINLRWENFYCPEHKAATYAQCARLYAACLDLPEDEVLITSDVDMAVFKNIFTPNHHGSYLTVIGNDLVPDNQYPICYCYGTVKSWRHSIDIGEKSYQDELDNLLGEIEAEHFRGNYWGKDQETLFNKLQNDPKWLSPRARPGTQFATQRIDRDDSFWRERLNKEVIDAHLWREGYTEQNFNNILELLQYMYPEDDFGWLREYRNQYIRLL